MDAGKRGAEDVPGVIRGTRTVLPGDQWFPRRSPISVDLSDPIRPTGNDCQAVVQLHDRVRQTMLTRCGEPDLEELVKPEST